MLISSGIKLKSFSEVKENMCIMHVHYSQYEQSSGRCPPQHTGPRL